MFIFDDEFYKKRTTMQGITLTNTQKENYKIFMERCAKYIQPSLDTISFNV